MCLISETVAGGRSHPRDAIIKTLRFKASQPVPAGRRGSGSTADQKPFEWERCHRAADGLWRGQPWSRNPAVAALWLAGSRREQRVNDHAIGLTPMAWSTNRAGSTLGGL